MSKKEHFAWVEKYRPQTIDECVLPKRLGDFFKGVIETGDLQNMIFSGSSGIGKTTVARALARQLNTDILVINGSEQRNIDTLRTTVRQFVSTASMSNAPKIVLIDEADYLNQQSTQPALRNFMEEFSRTSRFIFTVNYPTMIFKELKSRMVSVSFDLSRDEIKEVIPMWDKHLKSILEKEEIEYSPKVLAQVVKKFFPDYRKTIHELQRFSMGGKLDVSIMQTMGDDNIDTLISHIREKSFSKCRVWVAENPHLQYNAIMTALWRKVDNFMIDKSIPNFVLLANQYAVNSTMVQDASINILAFLTELMLEGDFK